MKADWISPWWQAALLPARWVICGMRVPSLTVWHTFALENTGNPYLCGGACDLDHACALLMFAGTDRIGGRRIMLDASYRRKLARQTVRRLSRVGFPRLHDALTEYVTTCTRTASRWHGSSSGKASSVPYQWHLVYCMTQGDPALMDRAWNTPYAVARCIYDADAEHDGDDTILSYQAQEMEDNWPEYEKQMQEAEKACQPSHN